MRIAGISCTVPKGIVQASDAHEALGRDRVERIVRNAGVLTRRVAPAGVTTIDLCAPAAEELLDALGWGPDSVDLAILVTQTPDYVLPATVHIAHQRLGLSDRCLAFHMNLGCSGFTHGLLVVRGLMQSDVVKRALLLCGDTISRVSNPLDGSTAVLFGDAGTATAVEAGEDTVRGAAWGSDGAGVGTLIVPGGSFRMPWRPELLRDFEHDSGNRRRATDLAMDGAKIFEFTIKRVPPMVQRILKMAQWQIEDVDAFVFHQANKFIIDYLRKKLKVPTERAPTCLEEYGNTSSASIPLTLVTRMRERLGEPMKMVLVGFGVGFSWSAVAIDNPGTLAPKLLEV